MELESDVCKGGVTWKKSRRPHPLVARFPGNGAERLFRGTLSKIRKGPLFNRQIMKHFKKIYKNANLEKTYFC